MLRKPANSAENANFGRQAFGQAYICKPRFVFYFYNAVSATCQNGVAALIWLGILTVKDTFSLRGALLIELDNRRSSGKWSGFQGISPRAPRMSARDVTG